jgi:hypothetical protein
VALRFALKRLPLLAQLFLEMASTFVPNALRAFIQPSGA